MKYLDTFESLPSVSFPLVVPNLVHTSQNRANNSIKSFSDELVQMGISQANINIILQKTVDIVDNLSNDFVEESEKVDTNFGNSDFGIIWENNISKYKSTMKSFATSYKRKMKFRNDEPLYVNPINKNIGLHWQKKMIRQDNGGYLYEDQMVPLNFQYVPIIKTLEVLFTTDSFCKLYFGYNHECSDEIPISKFLLRVHL